MLVVVVVVHVVVMMLPDGVVIVSVTVVVTVVLASESATTWSVVERCGGGDTSVNVASEEAVEADTSAGVAILMIAEWLSEGMLGEILIAVPSRGRRGGKRSEQ